ncbi:MAG: NAD(P)/FAD-dependent oxidoreductase [Caldilineaceae bacterium]|nr:NAD(P)/FAD-dependent oxidoreductase [Caldilineaceae bacterium]
MQPKVVIIGGGFGGLYAAKALKRAPVDVTLIDRRNFHLFQPLLYQVATSGLSPGDIAAPLRSIVRNQRNTRVLLGEVVDIDVEASSVVLDDGERIPYDYLIVATGATHSYFGKDQWAAHAPGLKTIEDALAIRRRVLLAYETAERETDPDRIQAWLTFVVVGGGPTGVELAGALGEMANFTLRRDFRNINPATTRVLLVEMADRVLTAYPPRLSQAATESLQELGVTVRTGTRVVDIRQDAVVLQSGDTAEEIRTHMVLWAAGVQASPLGSILHERTGAELDRVGRVVVAPDCSVPGHPEIFVVGDLARFDHGLEQPLPGVAPVAMQQGSYVARLITRQLRGETLPPFRYHDKGSMATIGRAAAVAKIGPLQFSGLPAWLAWLFVHLMYLVGFANRLLVFIQWAWNYLTYRRHVRLIVGGGAVDTSEQR